MFDRDDVDPFTTPCPPWCEERGKHRIVPLVRDRLHVSPSLLIYSSATDMTCHDGAYHPAYVDAYLLWRHLYTEPFVRVCVSTKDERELNLTVDEATALRDRLTELIDLARGGAS